MRMLIMVTLTLFLFACGGTNALRHEADTLAGAAGLQHEIVPTRAFQITIYARLSQPDQPVTFYFEGDGNAWLTRTRPSPNPTPRNPIGLRLAALDPSPNVVYVARPCQYTPLDTDRRCQAAYWTKRRLAPEIISSMNEVVEFMRRRVKSSRVRFVGYSGGGAVAVLVAARRYDVSDIRTLAGNLDTDAFVAHHEVSPMDGSLNPVAVASEVARIPQLHLVGAKDSIMPIHLAEGYWRASNSSPCIRIVEIPEATHHEHWQDAWRRWMTAPVPSC